MNRTFATTTLALGLFGLAACKGGAGDAVKLVPDSATVIAGVDLKGVQDSKLYKDYKDKIEAGAKEQIEAAKKCELGPDKWKSAVIGANPEKGEGAMVAIVSADGLGKKETLECIIKESGEKAPFSLEDDGKTIKPKGDEGTGYVIDDNTIVFAGKDWASTVKDLVDGKGKSVNDGELKDILGRTDTGKHIWFAGKLPADMQEMAGQAGFKPKDLAGFLHLASGLELSVSAGVDDADAAKDAAQKSFDQFKGMATSMGGVPQSVVDSVKIDSKGGAVTVEMKASDEELTTIMAQAKDKLPF